MYWIICFPQETKCPQFACWLKSELNWYQIGLCRTGSLEYYNTRPKIARQFVYPECELRTIFKRPYIVKDNKKPDIQCQKV